MLPYYLPKGLASRLMARLFRTQELSREIMLLHHNIADLTALVTVVAEAGHTQGLRLPGFEADVQCFRRFVEHPAAAVASS